MATSYRRIRLQTTLRKIGGISFAHTADGTAEEISIIVLHLY